MFSAINFTSPYILFSGVVLLIILVVLKFKLKKNHNKAGTRLSFILNLFVILLLLISLSNPSFTSKVSQNRSALFFLDVSGSCYPGDIERAIEEIRNQVDLIGKEHCKIFFFAGNPIYIPIKEFTQGYLNQYDKLPIQFLASSLSHITKIRNEGIAENELLYTARVTQLYKWIKLVNPYETDAISALNSAKLILGEDIFQQSRKFVFSDVAFDSFQAEKLNNIAHLNIYKISSSESKNASIISIDNISIMEAMTSFPVSIKLRSNYDVKGSLTLSFGDNIPDLHKDITLVSDKELIISFPKCRLSSGLYSIKARLDVPNDSDVSDNELYSGIFIRGNFSALILTDYFSEAEGLSSLLAKNNITSDIATFSTMPSEINTLCEYSVIILYRPNVNTLKIENVMLLEKFVNDFGGGIFTISGGIETAGKLNDSLLSSLMPVKFPKLHDEVKPEANSHTRGHSDYEVLAPSVAIAFVLDTSGSMMGDKLRLAKESAILTMDALNPADQVCAISFDEKAHLIMDLTSAYNKTAATLNLSKLKAGGGTNIYDGVNLASNILSRSIAKIKHIIILSDGYHYGLADFKSLVSNISAQNITVSTIGIGSNFDSKLLSSIASWGKGRFYFTDNFDEIPQIFINETKRILKKVKKFNDRNNGSPGINNSAQPNTVNNDNSTIIKRKLELDNTILLREVSKVKLPEISTGFIPILKNNARNILFFEDGTPFMAFKYFGRGKSVIWCGDLTSDKYYNWLEYDYLPTLLNILLKEIGKPKAIGANHLNYRIRSNGEKYGLQISVNISSLKNKIFTPKFDISYKIHSGISHKLAASPLSDSSYYIDLSDFAYAIPYIISIYTSLGSNGSVYDKLIISKKSNELKDRGRYNSRTNYLQFSSARDINTLFSFNPSSNISISRYLIILSLIIFFLNSILELLRMKK